MKRKALKCVFKFMKMICIGIIFAIASFKFALLVSKNKDKATQKYKSYYLMMCAWMDILEKGSDIAVYLRKQGYKNIAVYGGHEAARHLISQLHRTEICVKYIIDKAIFSGQFYDLAVYRPDEELPDVDVIIVTPIWDYSNVKEKLEKKVKCPIVSLEQIVMEVKGE